MCLYIYILSYYYTVVYKNNGGKNVLKKKEDVTREKCKGVKIKKNSERYKCY